MVSGYLADYLGRKRALLIASVIFTLTSIATAYAHDFGSFVTWRMAGGVGIGMASGLSPMYIAEIAPPSSRGRLVCLNQIAIVLGLLGAQIVNWLIARPVPGRCHSPADCRILEWAGGLALDVWCSSSAICGISPRLHVHSRKSALARTTRPVG
jgi:SP family sugar porter-like MFS transporter